MKKTVVAIVFATAALGAAVAFPFLTKTPTDKGVRKENGKSFYLSATWRGEFRKYQSYLLEIPQNTAMTDGGTQTFDQYKESIRRYSFPDGFIAQEFCELWSRRFAVGGKMGTDESALGTGKMYELTYGSGGIVPRLVAKTEEYRFRDCSFGKIGGRDYLAMVTQWQGFLYLYDIATKRGERVHIPYYGKANNKVTTMHFVEFADLDADGNDEVYLTATTPEFGRFGNGSWYQEGTVFQVRVDPGSGTVSEPSDIGGLENSFVKRVKKIRVGNGKDLLLVGMEGQLTEDWKSKVPFSLHAYGAENGKIVHRENVLQVPENKECKELTTYSVLWKGIASLQLGCDTGDLYAYGIRGTGLDDLSFDLAAKTNFRWKVTEGYLSQRDMLFFWDVIQIHSLIGEDFDGDGTDELLAGVNNTGLYWVKILPDRTVRTDPIFEIERVFPEPVGRLMLFALSDEPEGRMPAEPLFPAPIFER